MAYSKKQHYVAEQMGKNKYQYISIFPTALAQLDHIFNVVGNGVIFSQEDGVYHPNFPIEHLQNKRQEDLVRLDQRMVEMKERFGSDVVDQRYSELYCEERKVFEEEYSIILPEYYFNLNNVVNEHLDYIKNNTGIPKYLQPYPYNGGSIILRLNAESESTSRKLGLICTKAWIKIMEYHFETRETPEQKQLCQDWITSLNELVTRIETKVEK